MDQIANIHVYIIKLLKFISSRSYHDINQYPVFPWIITDYVSENIPDLNSDNNPELTNASDYVPKIRPMNTPMGMMELNEAAKDRKDNYIINLESPDIKNPDEKILMILIDYLMHWIIVSNALYHKNQIREN